MDCFFNSKWGRLQSLSLSLAYQPCYSIPVSLGEGSLRGLSLPTIVDPPVYLISSTSPRTTHSTNLQSVNWTSSRLKPTPLETSIQDPPWRILTKVSSVPSDHIIANSHSRAQHQRQARKPEPPARHVLLLQPTLSNRNRLHLLPHTQQSQRHPHARRDRSRRTPPPRPILNAPPELRQPRPRRLLRESHKLRTRANRGPARKSLGCTAKLPR